MCKILLMSGITEATRKNAWDFVHEMACEMSSHDKDGMGYAAIDSHGNLFGERWLDNEEAFDNRSTIVPPSSFETSIINEYKGMISKPAQELKYDSYGDPLNSMCDMTSITLHARMATSSKKFENTHPFFSGNVSLIHNGVIRNTDELDYEQSTCDSEGILTEYIKHDVANVPKNIQKVADNLEGYYACGMFSKTSKGQIHLDIFKDNAARLTAYFIKELNTVVFSTSEHHVQSACTSLGFTIISSFEVSSGKLLRINAMTGKVISVTNFKPEYKGKYYAKKAPKELLDVIRENNKSKGQVVDDWEYDGEGWSKIPNYSKLIKG